jgi:ketosteroid isomerase-like protein
MTHMTTTQNFEVISDTFNAYSRGDHTSARETHAAQDNDALCCATQVDCLQSVIITFFGTELDCVA